MDIVKINLSKKQYEIILSLANDDERFILTSKEDIERGFKFDENSNKVKIGSHTKNILLGTSLNKKK